MKNSANKLFLLCAILPTSIWAIEPNCENLKYEVLPSLTAADLGDPKKLANWVAKASMHYNSQLEATKSKRSINCTNLSVELSDTKLDINSEWAAEKNKKLSDLNTFSDTCAQELSNLLKQEKDALTNHQCKEINIINDTNKSIENDIAQVESAREQIEIDKKLLSQSLDPNEPIKNFSKEQLQLLIAEDKLASIATEKPYYGVMELGATLMPKYDKDGNNQGFQDANYYAALKLNNRWALKNSNINYTFFRNLVTYQEMDILFYSAPIACNSETEAPPEQNLDNASVSSSDNTQDSCNTPADISTLKFNDVSHTVNASVSLSFLYADKDFFGDWELGFNARSGLLNREKLSPELDSVSTYSSGGVEFRLNDFLDRNIDGKKYRNGLPRFIFNYSIMENHDFAGTNTTASRKVSQLSYRIYEDQPVYFGLVADVGRGPDSIALTLTYGIKPNNFFGLFSGN